MTPSAIHQHLEAAASEAAGIARERPGREVGVVPGTAPGSSALLRFDVNFDDGAQLTWFVSNEDATGFSDMLIGGTGDRNAVLTEMHLDALSGVFSDMLERAVVGLGSGLTEPITAGGVDMGMEGALPAVDGGAVQEVFALTIDGFGELAVVQHANVGLVNLLVSKTAAAPPPAAAPVAAPDPEAAAAAILGEQPAADNVVQLPNLTSAAAGPSEADLRMLLNVPLNVTVELGRAERTVHQLLELNVGSILELSKLAGDPMDILVNGKVLARGEVVVIDEEFGIRITEILSPEQRLRQIS